MKKKFTILLLCLLIQKNNTLRINIFNRNRCQSKISIKKNNIISDKHLKKNDKFYIYIEGEKSLKAKIIKEYKPNKDIQNTGIIGDLENKENNGYLENTENNDDFENDIQYNDDIEKKYKNNIINIPENILSLFFFLFFYLSMNSYMFGVQLRRKIDNIINK